MYNYNLSEKAKEDLLRIYEFGKTKFGINQADKYFEMMHSCFEKIASNPYMFPAVPNIKKIITNVFVVLMQFIIR